jgi:predicted Fe-Mo cluster-binding NifX family protein
VLAIPLHGDEVAPRFCSSNEFMIAELKEKTVYRVHRMTVSEEAWPRRLERLAEAGVKVLLCGGFNRSYLPLAEGLGILVVPGLAGKANDIVDAFLRNELERYRFIPCEAVRDRRRGKGWLGRISGSPNHRNWSRKREV